MSGRPESVDPRVARGREVRSVAEIVHADGEAVALRIAFADGDCLVCTAWTDWTLVVEPRPDAALPDYFWPASSFTTRPLPFAAGAQVVSAAQVRDEVGQVMGADFLIGDRRVSVRAYGGGINVTA
ncbi:hypothetical protein [Lentzea sp. NPDC060358]|uniref:hypothetical protein n=1 Tax=Lentzea sp. NPDC060358 TaxID=3347103 RepID=UPI00365565B1